MKCVTTGGMFLIFAFLSVLSAGGQRLYTLTVSKDPQSPNPGVVTFYSPPRRVISKIAAEAAHQI